MPTPPLSNEDAIEAFQAFQRHGSERAAAKALGMNRSTYRNRLRVAEFRGLTGRTPPAPTGFEVKAISETTDALGNVKARSTKYQEEGGGPYKVPDGHKVKGESVLTDADGQIRAKWTKTAEIKDDPARIAEIILEGMREEIPRAKEIAAPAIVSGSAALLNAFVLADVHLGMFAWGEENGGDDWDLSIAEKTVSSWAIAAMDCAPNAKDALFIKLGDWKHTDGLRAETPRSRHVLDADSRWQKICRTSIRLDRFITRAMLERHQRVFKEESEGNHDESSIPLMREMWAMHYENDPRVIVDTDPSLYHCHRHGQTTVFSHHGHIKRNAKQVASACVASHRDVWGASKHSYFHIGHEHHHESVETEFGVVEMHQTLAARDSHASRGGYFSGRSAQIITYHEKYGEVGRNRITPQMLDL